MTDYEDNFVRECAMCSKSYKLYPHEPASDYCISCRGKRWQGLEDDQMKILVSMNKNLEKLVRLMEAK